MEFYKETIIGQVLNQVQTDKSNRLYFKKIDALMDDILDLEYMDVKNTLWQKQGLYITDKKIIKKPNSDWIYVESPDAYEYSWLVENLVEIYQPKSTEIHRLLTTIGYLLNVYGMRSDSLTEVLRITTITSTVFLHKDHIGQDRFKIHPISLPPFGRDF